MVHSQMLTETLTTNTTASVTIPLTVCASTADTQTVTLADGTTVGQVKIFQATNANATDITPDTTAGAYTKFTLTNIGDTVVCIWTGVGWAIISRASGSAAGNNAVVDMPIIS